MKCKCCLPGRQEILSITPLFVISSIVRNLTEAITLQRRESLMGRKHQYFIYLLTNWNNKVMYIGMTNNLMRRVYEHKAKIIKGFTEKYNVNRLVYFEETSDVHAALHGRRKSRNGGGRRKILWSSRPTRNGGISVMTLVGPLSFRTQ